MRLILTHSNADFDAVASLVGMHKLDPAAIPVLPSRLLRNVQNFLTLHAFPFWHQEDITPDTNLTFVYLVDTQKYQSFSILSAHTPVHIIDHHPLTQQLPAHFTATSEPVGATATILTERLQREDLPLSSLESTLLMMGIYEDTGSLTYASTTPRDIRAAAWLLEHGAKLDIARQFLSYPLDDAQWNVYDQLRDTATLYEIKGHSVLVATAVHDQVEISSIAYQISSLYEPSALILAVQMGPKVQLVARSSVDEIDVGEIAQHYGGGGHQRAAAAVIHQADLQTIVDQIIADLHDFVHPSTTVAHLMSGGRIETIDHNATIADAEQLMQMSGHEGYPVLDSNRVVGLLTRRAVDRTMSHHMGNQPIHQIMEARDDVYVHPDDSLETLRQRMIDTGWGQMPVVDQAGQLIGIVTRTDLIRLWSEGPRNNRQRRLIRQRLEQMLPVGLWGLLQSIASQAQGTDLYLVGGLVRDLLLGVPNLDIDIVSEGDAVALVRQLCQEFGGDMRHHQQFGTAKWIIGRDTAIQLGLAYTDEWPEFIDFATARAEFYKEPTALPTVRRSSIKQDLHRRDFTINSMAIRLSPEPMGELIDFYNGKRDLDQGCIRVLHSLSFVDDPTRMIRAVRFEQRYGFQIEPRTASLLHDALPFIDRVTGERLRNEIRHILREPVPLKVFKRLEGLGILQQIYPDLKVDTWVESAMQAYLYAKQTPPWPLPDDEWYLGMFSLLTARLPGDTLEALGKRLQISRTQLKVLHAVRDGYAFLLSISPATRPSAVVAALEPMPEICWLVLWAAAPTAELRRTMVQFVTRWRHIDTNFDGNRLRELGVEPGPIMGDLLHELRTAWLDGHIKTADEEHQYLQRLLAT